jgi:hypothetical protein
MPNMPAPIRLSRVFQLALIERACGNGQSHCENLIVSADLRSTMRLLIPLHKLAI